MATELERLKVVLEGDNSSYKKSLNDALSAARKSTEQIRKQTESVHGIFAGIKKKIGNIQVRAGIKVQTPEFRKAEMALDNVRKRMKELKKEEELLRSAGSDTVDSARYEVYAEDVAKAENELRALAEAQKQLEAEGKATTLNARYAELAAQLEKAEQKLQHINDYVAEQHAKGYEGDVAYPDRTPKGTLRTVLSSQAIEETSRRISELRAEMEQLKSSGRMETPSEAARKLSEQFADTKQELEGLLAEMKRMDETGESVGTERWKQNQQDIAETAGQMRELSQEEDELIAKNQAFVSTGRGWAAAGKIIETAGNGIARTIRLLTTMIGRASGAFSSLIHRFSSGIPSMQKFGGATRSAHFDMGKLVKTLLRYGLGIRSMFFLFNKVRAAIKEGFSNLARYDDSTNQSISTLMSSLTQLKNSLAAAFAPVLQVIAPILNQLIQMLISAANAVGQFLSAITGKGFYVRAKNVTQDYAASLDKTSASTDKANSSAKEYQKTLLGFDQITKLGDDSSNSSGSSGNSSGLSPGDMFEQVSVDSTMKDFAKMIKEAWEKADLTEIGKSLGQKLNSALENINWDKIRETCGKITKSIATFINGFVEGTNWDLVGSSISNGIQTIFYTVNAFVSNLNWESIGDAAGRTINGILDGFYKGLVLFDFDAFGESIASFLNSAIQRTDFGKAGEALRKAISSVFSVIRSFLYKFDFVGAAKSVAAFLATALDPDADYWGIAADALHEAINGILDFLNTLGTEAFPTLIGVAQKIRELFEDAINDELTWEKAGTALSGFIGGIADFLKNMLPDYHHWFLLGVRVRALFKKVLHDEMTWEKVGTALRTLMEDIIGFLEGALPSQEEWEELGSKVGELIEGIPWKRLLEAAWEAISTAFVGLISGLWGSGMAGKITVLLVGITRIGWVTSIVRHIGKLFLGDNSQKILVDYFGQAMKQVLTSEALGSVISGILPGLAIGGAIAGGVLIAEKFAELADLAQGGNGKLSEAGGVIDSMLSEGMNRLGEFRHEIFLTKEALEESNGSAKDYADALREGFENAGVSYADFERYVGNVKTSMSLTEEQAWILDEALRNYHENLKTYTADIDWTGIKADAADFSAVLYDNFEYITQKCPEAEQYLRQYLDPSTYKDPATMFEALKKAMEDAGLSTENLCSFMKDTWPNAVKVVEESTNTSTGKTTDLFNTMKSAITGRIDEITTKVNGFSLSSITEGAKGAKDETEGLGTKIGGLAGKLSDTIKMALYGTAVENMGKKGKTAAENVGTLDNAFSSITNALPGYTDNMLKGSSDIGDAWTEGLVTKIDDGKKDIMDSIGGITNSMISEPKKTLGISSPSRVMKDIGRNVGLGLKNGLEAEKSGIAGMASSISESIIRAFDGISNSLYNIGQQAAQSLSNGFSGTHIVLPHITNRWQRYTYGNGGWFDVPNLSVSWYGKGGFPDTGSLFIASENGPEMVGTMDGRTTVANNNQIISGIRAGVFEAVVYAIESTRSRDAGNDQQPVFNIYVGGKRVTDVVIEDINRRTRTNGVCPINT